jgi:hypothetical protein
MFGCRSYNVIVYVVIEWRYEINQLIRLIAIWDSQNDDPEWWRCQISSLSCAIGLPLRKAAFTMQGAYTVRGWYREEGTGGEPLSYLADNRIAAWRFETRARARARRIGEMLREALRTCRATSSQTRYTRRDRRHLRNQFWLFSIDKK